jgi:3-hydroxyacyl-[acyl-carrier-protein] dehydratase
MNNSGMDIELIKKFLPHRYPFLMLDRILEINSGENITAIKNVSSDAPYFQGHFPDVAVMPGVLMLEAIAQASGILAYATAGVSEYSPKDLYFFAGVDKVKFKKIVTPGDQLKIFVELIQNKKSFSIFRTKGSIFVGDDLVCYAEILCAKKGMNDEQ